MFEHDMAMGYNIMAFKICKQTIQVNGLQMCFSISEVQV